MRKRTSTEQSYEPLVTPESWKGDELRFSVRLTQILDGLFARLRAMRTELAGKLGRTEQAADSAKLGGADASSYALKSSLNIKLYTDPTQFGAAADSTPYEFHTAFPDDSMYIGNVGDLTDAGWDFPNNTGTLEFKRDTKHRNSYIFRGKGSGCYYSEVNDGGAPTGVWRKFYDSKDVIPTANGGTGNTTGTAADSAKLGGVPAGSYALKTDTAPNAEKLGGKAPSEYALQTELSGKLGRNEKAADSAKLGGLDANRYMKYTDAVEILPSASYSVGAVLPFSESPDNFRRIAGRLDYVSFVPCGGSGGSDTRRYVFSAFGYSSTGPGASPTIVQAQIVGTYKANNFVLEKVTKVNLTYEGTYTVQDISTVHLGPIMGKKYF